MSHTVSVTGVPRDGSSLLPPPPRLDIRDLIKNTKQFALYVQALTAMMQTSQDDILSWFAISGIHGLPATAWNGAKPPSGRWYCHHGVLTFPTWHRPYTALYEQVLQGHAVRIADTYTTPDKQEWLQAAIDLRAPYWDWASEAVPPPEVIELQQLNIILPDGTEGPIDNPLLTYRFNPRPSFSSRAKTVRCPVPSSSTETNLRALIDSLQGRGPRPPLDWRTSTYDMLTRTTTWATMSNGISKHGQGGERDAVNSLETIHGDVHVIVGGNGQMSQVPVAAFDPIFWLHHVNVDRVLALWEALHPGEWVPAPQLTQDLLPFWADSTSFWRSEATRSTEPLNYIYPEFIGLVGSSPEDRKNAITVRVNQLYGDEDDIAAAAALMGASSFAAIPQGVLSQKSAQPSLEDRLDWTARVRSKLHQFGKSYTVLIFVGQPPAEEHDWRTSPHFAGSFAAFVNASPEECENCQDQADAVVEGFVSLRKFLQRYTQLETLEPEVVIPFLKDQIHWRIQL
ncbi:hypothetical protein FRC02_012164, partial [Tulasnella sp. 418]